MRDPGADDTVSAGPVAERVARPVAAAASRARLTRIVVFVLALGLTAGALVTLLSSSGGIDDILRALGHVSGGWAVAAVGATVVGHFLNALHLRRLTAGRIPLWRAARTDLLLFGLGNVLPGAPAPGALLAAAELRRAGLSARRARLVLAFTAWFNVRTLLGIAALSFLLALVGEHPGLREAGLWWIAAVAVIVALAASARLAARTTTAEHGAEFIARLRVTRPRPPAEVTRATAAAWHAEVKATVGIPINRVVLVALAAGSWIADAACLDLALTAAGVRLDADIVLLSYVAGVLISALPLLPAGIGVVEAAIPAVLHYFGAPLDAALAGTLVYRGISLLLPAASGALIVAHLATSARRLAPETPNR
jgi:uncharacterized protein (TIRG00374 family)